MAVPRPILLTLLGTLLLAVTFLATRNAQEQAAEAPAPPVQQQAAVPEPAPKQAEKSKPRADKTEPGKGSSDRQPAAKERAANERAKAAAPSRERNAAPGTGGTARSAPSQVKRALAAKRTVVLFFYQAGGSEDRSVARGLAALRGRTKAAIFSAPLSQLGRYSSIVTGMGVTRAPSVVVVGKSGRGHLIEGYIDPDALAQSVADAQ